MQLHDVRNKKKPTRHKRVGRGGKRGKTSGRGTKGQKARAGHRIRPAIRDIIKKLPKRRGRGRNFLTSIQTIAAVVTLSAIEAAFKKGETVTPRELVSRGLVKETRGRLPTVKILGGGKVTKKILFSRCLVSRTARESIEKAGGTISAT